MSQSQSYKDELSNILKGTNYRLKLTSWNDISRYSSSSSHGSNITDVKLIGKDGRLFYIIRSDNWNEKVGTVSSKEVTLIDNTEHITLDKYLESKGLSSQLDDKISIRFQTTFIPITDDDYGSVQFCSTAYNYNTYDNGVSSAARVSKGSNVKYNEDVTEDANEEVTMDKYKRSETENITITVMLYHIVKGLPTKEDVIAVVTELDKLYDSCTWSGNLKDMSKYNVIPASVIPASVIPEIKT